MNSHPCKRGRNRDELGLADPGGDVGLSAGVAPVFEDLPGGAVLWVGYRYLLCERGLRWPVSAGPERTSKTMKYMLMFWVDESGEVTAEEDAAMMIDVKSWVEEMSGRGVLLDGGALRSAAEAKIVRMADGEVLVSDGPFAETKEQIGGYDVIDCADLDAAIQIAARHPLARTVKVEVRPYWDAPWDH